MKTFTEFFTEGKVDKAITSYAKKSGGIDKDDMLAVADAIKGGMTGKDLGQMLRAMDTDPRDGILQIIQKTDRSMYNDVLKGMK
jgi:hypothetical protein